jgi:hypothetical protein
LRSSTTLIGTDHASADVQEIVRAASAGRVEHLFLLENGAVPGAVDGGADLLDTAVVQTLRHGGDVQTLLKTSMPSGGHRQSDKEPPDTRR